VILYLVRRLRKRSLASPAASSTFEWITEKDDLR